MRAAFRHVYTRQFTQHQGLAGPWKTRSSSKHIHNVASIPTPQALVRSDAQRSTIYALSTPPGKAGVAVVRVSGPDALHVWQHMVVAHTGKSKDNKAKPQEPWRMYRCDVVHPRTRELLDSALAVYFRGPRSFTGEDVLELHIHSGRAIISSTLDALGCIPACRLAEPGEFTRRAFEAGRLDLTEVEGLHDLINAETTSQRKAALQAVAGELRTRFESLRQDVLRSLSLVEALIDFGEEEVEEGVYAEAKDRASKAVHDITTLLFDYRRGEILRSGIKLAIFGPPNAGKSSLLNLLAQRDAAIVTSIPGTTRDVLELTLDIGGLPVIVSDTAGIRATDDPVEKIGVARAAAAVSDADVRLCVLSLPDVLRVTEGNTLDVPEGVAAALTRDNTIVLLNKTDLLGPFDSPHGETIAKQVEQQLHVGKAWPVSICTRDGIDIFLRELGEILKKKYDVLDVSWDRAAPLVINSRHRAHLESALQFLQAFLADPDNDIVLAAEELRYAAQAIGRITGRIDVEDILDTIFRDFCIGK